MAIGFSDYFWIATCALLTLAITGAAAWPAKVEAFTPYHSVTRLSQHPESDEYERASLALPEFCRQWESKLRERERHQAELIEWQDREGWKTATYRGYSPIQSCTCKLKDGVPVGEITYNTIEYYLAGHTVDEARHAHPIVAGSTTTTEIVRWNDGKWEYK